MQDAGFGLLAVLLFAAIGLALVCISGLFVYITFHFFHLVDIIPITFWQACGIGWLVGGAGGIGLLISAVRSD